MGQSAPSYISYEDVVDMRRIMGSGGGGNGNGSIIMINVLPDDATSQSVLIAGTTVSSREVEVLNGRLASPNLTEATTVIVYGRNTMDTEAVQKKGAQLCRIGFPRVLLYLGGMFEWALLRELYGADEFPLSSEVGPTFSPLSFRPMKLLTAPK